MGTSAWLLVIAIVYRGEVGKGRGKEEGATLPCLPMPNNP